MRRLTLTLTVLAALATPALARANTVTDWNRTMIAALETAKTPPPPANRAAAIVQAAVYDAANGIHPRFTPYRVAAAAPPGASRAAAAAGAAHEALSALFPDQKATFDAQLAPLSASTDPSIVAGLAWGRSVADQILSWRAGDGLNAVLPPYVPGDAPGDYQPTPPAFGPPAFRQFAAMAPFALASPSQFDPGPPPGLESRRYLRDLAEVERVGGATGAARADFDTQTAIFWQADTPAAMWDRVADDLADRAGVGLLPAARRLALTNIALADATIAVWNAKNEYDRWRPVTAIAAGGDPSWTPLLVTPAFQEYPAGHPGVSAGAAGVLAAFYGDRTRFTVTSAGLPGVQRGFAGFQAAVRQVEDARVFGGIHFRFSTTVAARMGRQVAAYVLDTVMRPLCRRPR
jgi:hypothetical protein